MIVLCPVPGLVRRRCPAAHRNPLPRWIQTVNPLTMGFVHVWMPLLVQVIFERCKRVIGCGHVSGLCVR